MIELTKSQKKTARKLINLGLQRECAKFMQSTKDFMNKNASAEDAHDAYTSNYMIRYTNSTSISLADTMGCQEVDITSPYVTYTMTKY